MLEAPSVGRTLSSKGCFMPIIPAVPKNSAYVDQRKAADVPIDTRVSIVAVPWRRLVQVARWNGQAAQMMTGPVSANASHCQAGNCNAGTIDIAITGTASTMLPTRRWRRSTSSASRRSVVGCSGSSGLAARGSTAV